MQTTDYTTSVNRAYDATCVSSANSRWLSDQDKLAASPKPLCWDRVDKFGRWLTVDLRPGAVPR
jgi:hypothetical protein